MKLFSDNAIQTAKERTLELYRKLAVYTPDEKLTASDIDTIMFYLRDYRDELKSIERRREESRRK